MNHFFIACDIFLVCDLEWQLRFFFNFNCALLNFSKHARYNCVSTHLQSEARCMTEFAFSWKQIKVKVAYHIARCHIFNTKLQNKKINQPCF